MEDTAEALQERFGIANSVDVVEAFPGMTRVALMHESGRRDLCLNISNLSIIVFLLHIHALGRSFIQSVLACASQFVRHLPAGRQRHVLGAGKWERSSLRA